MNLFHKIIMILFLIPINNIIVTQELMVLTPQHLGLSTSTARVGNLSYANSALAQAYYNQKTSVSLSLYVPYQQLTDGRMRTNAATIFFPSFYWGSVNLSYGNFTASNFDQTVLSKSIVKLGYTNAFLKRAIIALAMKWNNTKWYSDNQSVQSINGISIDLSTIYIMNRSFSLGLNINNIFSPKYSSLADDRAIRSYRLTGLWNNFRNSLSIEGGIIVEDDCYFNQKIGALINSDIALPLGFTIGAEYKRLFFNEIGALFAFNYKISNIRTQVAYSIRFDDSPFPISTLKHAWSIQFSFDKLKGNTRIINPQILLQDQDPPTLYVERISPFNVLTKKDHSDPLKLKVNINDDQSGLDMLDLKIYASTDSLKDLYHQKYKLQDDVYEDTLIFDGYLNKERFLENNKYLVRITTKDQAGNKNQSSLIPFRILSTINDSIGPAVHIKFDTSKVIYETYHTQCLLDAQATINDNETDWVRWRIKLYKLIKDTNWKNIKTLPGGIEIFNRDIKWLLKDQAHNPIQGKYKIKIEAEDELKNTTIVWSGEKTIINGPFDEERYVDQQITQTFAVEEKRPRKKEKPKEQRFKQREFRSQPVKPVLKPDTLKTVIAETVRTVVTIPETLYVAVSQPQSAPQAPIERYTVETYYSYRNQDIILSDFIFEKARNFNVDLNKQSLSVVGVYLQDIENSLLVIEYPVYISKVKHFEIELKNFFNEVYNIDERRIQFIPLQEYQSIHFIIKE